MSDVIETLAERIHEEWRKGDWPKKPHLDVPFAQLAPIDKENNRAAARRIADVLTLVGLGLARLEKAKSARKPGTEELVAYIEGNLERMAEAEHDGWMAQRAQDGWTYGVPRDDERKIHPQMRPYAELPEGEKQKDRNAVLHYPEQVRAAGFEIVWL